MEVLYRILVVVVFTFILRFALGKVINTKKIYSLQEMDIFSLIFSINVQLLCFKDINLNTFMWGLAFSVTAYFIFYALEWLVSFIYAYFFKKESIKEAVADGKDCSMFEQEAEVYNSGDKRIPFYGFLRFFGKTHIK